MTPAEESCKPVLRSQWITGDFWCKNSDIKGYNVHKVFKSPLAIRNKILISLIQASLRHAQCIAGPGSSSSSLCQYRSCWTWGWETCPHREHNKNEHLSFPLCCLDHLSQAKWSFNNLWCIYFTGTILAETSLKAKAKPSAFYLL